MAGMYGVLPTPKLLWAHTRSAEPTPKVNGNKNVSKNKKKKKWKCEVCTYENGFQLEHCKVCKTRNHDLPPAKAPWKPPFNPSELELWKIRKELKIRYKKREGDMSFLITALERAKKAQLLPLLQDELAREKYDYDNADASSSQESELHSDRHNLTNLIRCGPTVSGDGTLVVILHQNVLP